MKLRFRTKLSYGIGGIADNALFTITSTFLLFFLTTVAGINPAAAGTIAAIGSFWEAFCGPIVAYISDNTKTKYGKRKPFLLASAFPIAIITSLLFMAIDVSYGMKLFYYSLMTILFWTSFAGFFVPYMAWGSELTSDYHERTVLRTYVYIFNQVGMLIGMVLPMIIVDYLMNLGKTQAQSWQSVGMFVGGCSSVALLICALTIKSTDEPNFKKDVNKVNKISFEKIGNMFSEYLQILCLRPIKFLIGASVLYLIANTIFSSGRIYYFTYNLGLSGAQVSFTMLLITICGIVMAPFIASIAGKTDKKMVFTIGIAVTGALMIAFWIIGVSSFIVVCALCIVYAIGATCYWQLMPSMIYDLCEVEELISGEPHSGAVISLQALSESASVAVGLQILGIILEKAQFNSEALVQPELALTWVNNCFTLIPGILMVAVVGIMIKYPINQKSFNHVLETVEKQRVGEKADLKEFDYIFKNNK